MNTEQTINTPLTSEACDLTFETWEEKASQLQSAMEQERASLLENLIATESKLTSAARAFYVDGKPSAIRAVLSDWKAVAESARAAIQKARTTP